MEHSPANPDQDINQMGTPPLSPTDNPSSPVRAKSTESTSRRKIKTGCEKSPRRTPSASQESRTRINRDSDKGDSSDDSSVSPTRGEKSLSNKKGVDTHSKVETRKRKRRSESHSDSSQGSNRQSSKRAVKVSQEAQLSSSDSDEDAQPSPSKRNQKKTKRTVRVDGARRSTRGNRHVGNSGDEHDEGGDDGRRSANRDEEDLLGEVSATEGVEDEDALLADDNEQEVQTGW